MSRQLPSDLLGMLNGLRTILLSAVKLQESQYRQVWENSSIKSMTHEASSVVGSKIKRTFSQPSNIQVYFFFCFLDLFYSNIV